MLEVSGRVLFLLHGFIYSGRWVGSVLCSLCGWVMFCPGSPGFLTAACLCHSCCVSAPRLSPALQGCWQQGVGPAAARPGCLGTRRWRRGAWGLRDTRWGWGWGGTLMRGVEASVNTLSPIARHLHSAGVSRPELCAGPHVGPTVGLPDGHAPGLSAPAVCPAYPAVGGSAVE